MSLEAENNGKRYRVVKSVSIDVDVARRAEEAAAADCRNFSNYVEKLIIDAVNGKAPSQAEALAK